MPDSDDTVQLSPDHINIVDTNTLISAGGTTSPKYRQFRREVLAAGVTLLMPGRIESEVRDSGLGAALDKAIDEEWIEVVSAPSITDSDATSARDIVRRTIAAATSDKPEYEVETADPVLAGIAIEYLNRADTGNVVTILTSDLPARRGMRTAMSALGYDNQVNTVSLFDVIGEDGGDITVI